MAASVLIIMGSDSDWPVMEKCAHILSEFYVSYDVRVISAHRTPSVAVNTAKNARKKGVGTIICAAGMAAHLAGVIAAHTTLPVIGVPVSSGSLKGKDSLYSTVMMPPGVPVATVGINGSKNAGLLAVQILSVSDDKLAKKLLEFKKSMAANVKKADKQLRASLRK